MGGLEVQQRDRRVDFMVQSLASADREPRPSSARQILPEVLALLHVAGVSVTTGVTEGVCLSVPVDADGARAYTYTSATLAEIGLGDNPIDHVEPILSVPFPTYKNREAPDYHVAPALIVQLVWCAVHDQDVVAILGAELHRPKLWMTVAAGIKGGFAVSKTETNRRAAEG